MKPATLRALVGSLLLSLAAQSAAAASKGHAHRHIHDELKQAHNHSHVEQDHAEQQLKPRGRLTNRSGQCAFPEEAGLVTVTPSMMNAGWAMSPDEECTAGSYCPFACPSGKVMNQWKPGSSYVYPESMYGGLYCDESGEISKPYPSKDYCVDGVGTVSAVNNANGIVAFCQTVLPGNEAMLIPTSVDSKAVIAVPDTSYWDSTAAHYYVNEPGYSTDEACIWGTSAKAIGNWSPYVAGANQDASGSTFVKIGWNPKHQDDFYGVLPTFGLKIECPDGECNGLPCSIDPSSDGYGGVTSEDASSGAGGADFCVVTVTSGSAEIIVFDVGNSGSSSGSDDDDSDDDDSFGLGELVSSVGAIVKGLVAESTTSSASPSPSSTSTTSSATPTTTSTTTSSSSSSSTSISTTSRSSSSIVSSTSSVSKSSTSFATISSYTKAARPTTTLSKSTGVKGGIFQEAGASGKTTAAATTADTTTAASASASSTSNAGSNNQDSAAFAGFVVAFVAAAYLY